MNRKIRAIALSVFVTAALFSCKPLEQDTYYQTFYRIATVNYRLGTAYLTLDCTTDAYKPRNFKDTVDMQSFGLSAGDKIIAEFKIEAVGSMDNAVLTLESAKKISIQDIATEQPSDTLNFYYQMTKFGLTDVVYPDIWAVGHVVTIAPTYYVPSSSSKAEFHLYPLRVQGDTLIMRLYSDIPEADNSLRPYTQSLLCYDISSLRQQVSNPIEQERRDTILARLDRLEKDSITVHIVTPDTLRAKNSKNPANNYKYEQWVPNLPSTTTVRYDF